MTNIDIDVSKLKEPVLADDYPVYADFMYVADGKVVLSDYHGITVREFKFRLGAKEIRRCDIYGRSDQYFGRAA
jgi:hypothetical protein